MLSPKTLQFTSIYFSYGDALNLFPYDWNRQNFRLRWSNSQSYLILFIITLMYYTLESIYGLYVLVLIQHNPPEAIDLSMKLKIILHVSTRLMALGINYLMLLMSNSNMLFYNQLFNSHFNFHRKYA